MTSPLFPQSERSTVQRHPERAAYDREAVYRILDCGLVCTVAFRQGRMPCAIPMAYVRAGNAICIHGARKSRLEECLLAAGDALCVAVTLLDGLVLARSAFSHSMNYRSVVCYGSARAITEPGGKLEILRLLTERIAPGRWPEIRPPSEQELKGTFVLAIEIEEAAAKVRSGPPRDRPEDEEYHVWAGVVPLQLCAGEPLPAPNNEALLPEYLRGGVLG